jgi:diguanylate cyclase (GGDEF)-like protein
MTMRKKQKEAALGLSFTEERNRFQRYAIDVKASLGTASLEGHENELEDMIKRADRNLYTSKGRGGNRVTGGPGNG